jgi:hypothetical protein
MPYTLDTIQKTIERVLGKRVSKAKLKTELEKADWLPEDNRMIVIADSLEDLAGSNRYGQFVSFNGIYTTNTGRGRFARPLTVEEIAACY